MAVRQNIGVGGLYPTGRAPLAVDLSTTSGMITQRMIKREQERIAEEKGLMVESQKEILKALDFETVQGLTGEVQLKHLENVNNLWNKWANIYSQKQGKLGFPELKELKKDQTKVNYDLGRMQANVKEYAFAAKQLSDPNTRDLWEPESLIRLKEYAKKGVGSDGALDILVPKPPSFLEMVYDKLKPMVATLNKKFSYNIQTAVGPDGMERAVETNRQLAEQNWNSVKYQPWVKPYIDKYGEESVYNQFMDALGITLTKDKFHASVYNTAQNIAAKKGTSSLGRKYGVNVREDQVDNWIYMNNVVEGLAQGDKNIWGELQGQSYDGFYINKIDLSKDGKQIILSGVPGQDGSIKKKVIDLPDRNNKTATHMWKVRMLDALPKKIGGKQIDPNLAGLIVGDWMEFKGGEIVEPREYKELNSAIESIVNGNDRKSVVTAIKKAFPDLIVETPGWDILGKGSKKIIVKENQDDQGTLYDLTKKEDRDAATKFFREYSGIDKIAEGLKPPSGEKSEQEKAMLSEQDKNTLKNIVNQYGFDAVVDQYLKSDSTLTRDEVVKTFELNGIVK